MEAAWLLPLGPIVVALFFLIRGPRPKPEYDIVGFDRERGVVICAQDGDLGELLPEVTKPERAFPTHKLRALSGTLSRLDENVAIEVPLEPFRLPIYYDDEVEWERVATSLRLDWIQLPSTDLAELAGKTLHFPRSPEPGYIDGSLCVEHAHHPAEVTVIRFGDLTDDGLEAEMDVELCFEFEGLGDYRDTPWRCVTRLRAA